MRARGATRSVASTLLGCCLGATAIAACSPYDPELGLTPYLCGDQEPRCPGGYRCVDDGVSPPVCVDNDGTPPPSPDAAGFPCAMDGTLEPNDSINQASQTDVGTGAQMRVYGPISTCPEGDKDYFQINVTTTNKGISVITRWDSGTPVTCSILLATGNLLANCTAMGFTAERACATNLPVGPYYVYAYSAGGVRSNYRIEMKIVDNCVQ